MASLFAATPKAKIEKMGFLTDMLIRQPNDKMTSYIQHIFTAYLRCAVEIGAGRGFYGQRLRARQVETEASRVPGLSWGRHPFLLCSRLIPGTGGDLSVRVRGCTAMTAKAHQTRVLSLKVKAKDGAGEWKDLEVPKAEKAGLGQP